MSIHPSLRPSKGKGYRSVLKKFERLKILSEKEKWHEGESVFGLPKVKSIKFKVKKEKAAEAKAVEAAATPTAEAAQESVPSTQAATQPQSTPTKKEKPGQAKEKESS